MDEYRKVMLEGLEEICEQTTHLPKLGEVLKSVINEIRMLDTQVSDALTTIKKLNKELSKSKQFDRHK